ncbi:MAG TPA: glycosyltransferase family 2 protein [Candidatus Aquicultoraceae bacterium]|nr:glycosyltransferase family 2 protein [Candidatus Aquicultoraceae bacterium]
MDLVTGLLIDFQHTTAYWIMLVFFGFYPVFSAIVWLTTSIIYYTRKERLSGEKEAGLYSLPDPPPKVSVLIPTYCEEKMIEATLEGALAIEYPDFEVVVVDDGSTDGTIARIAPYVEAGRVRLIRKTVNEGKAMALNDALLCLNGEIVLTLDADAVVDPRILRNIVPHFSSARVAAVTGNPRVVNRRTLLSKIQLIEFTSIVGLLRRAQRVWGRIQTVSGVVVAFRKKALFDVGLFDPSMATEDIDMSWRLQKRFWDIRYEPKGLVWMQVPETLRAFFKQRKRWAVGLGQVLRRHLGILLHRKNVRQWPVAYESVLSILWSFCFVILTSLWIVSYSIGIPPVGADPIPNFWGMMIATVCIVQLTAGVLLDRHYDRSVLGYAAYTVLYPLVYWAVTSTIAFLYTPVGLLRRRPEVTLWKTERT